MAVCYLAKRKTRHDYDITTIQVCAASSRINVQPQGFIEAAKAQHGEYFEGWTVHGLTSM